MPHTYTLEQKEFIAHNAAGKSTPELTAAFNHYFGLNHNIQQIRAFKKNYGIISGLDTRFRKGQVSHNKGKKGVGGWPPTQFKKGNKPYNYKELGSERINGDGYVDIKIAEPNKWKGKHILTWEKENGPVPHGGCIIFGDGNNRNFEISNLILVTRNQLSVLNKNGLIQKDADLTRIGIVIADLQQKINKKARG